MATAAADGVEVVVPPAGLVPAAVAESLIDPLFRSACVTVYVAVHVTLAPGAIDAAPAGHVGPVAKVPAGALWVSVTPTSVRVTLPVLVTTKLYVTTAPTTATVVGDADFAIVNAGLWVAVTVAVAGDEVCGLFFGSLPVAVAESFIEPLFRSAWVTV